VTLGTALNHFRAQDNILQVCRAEQGKAYVFQEGAGLALTGAPVDPEQQRLKHLLLTRQLNMVARKELSNMAFGQIEKLFMVNHL
jgi:hypothetical protein